MKKIIIYILSAVLVLGGIGGAVAMGVTKANEKVDLPYVDYAKDNVYNQEMFYQNPQVKHLADPQVILAADGYYYLYATSLAINCYGFNMWRSQNLVNWEGPFECFTPSATDWGVRDYWAPEVTEVENDDGTYTYYMHYSAKISTGGNRLGIAVSSSPAGPFVNLDNGFDGRLVQPNDFEDLSQGYKAHGWNAIDAHVFKDIDGQLYVYWVWLFTANNGYQHLKTFGQKLADDYYTVLSDRVEIVSPAVEDGMRQDWEVEGVNEGPAMILHDGVYYLTYSGNGYGHALYGIGYATSDSPLGTFTKFENNPVMVKNPYSENPTGTGHHGVTQLANGEWYSFYHSHIDLKTSQDARQLNMAKIGFREDGTMFINGPTEVPVLLPSVVTSYRNFAPDATITTVKKGGNKAVLNDGEIVTSADEYYNQYLYMSVDEGQTDVFDGVGMDTITFTFDEAVEVSAFAIYANDTDVLERFAVQIILDGKYVLDAVTFSEKLGHAAIAEIAARKVKKVEFVFSQEDGILLSEIMIIGREAA